MANVLKVNALGDNFVWKDFGGSYSVIDVTFDIYVPSGLTVADYLGVQQFFTDGGDPSMTGVNEDGIYFFDPGTGNAWYYAQTNALVTSAHSAQNAWHTVSLHWNEGVSGYPSVQIDGTDYGPQSGLNHFGDPAAGSLFGAWAGATTGYFYMRDIKVGTTGYGSSDLFSEDFAGGTLANFTSTQGDVSVIADPTGGAPLAADFSGTPISGVAPLAVAFSDDSTGTPTGWDWDFGDGGTSTADNPSHVYTVAGIYTVSLVVTDGVTSDTKTRTDYVTVVEPAPNYDTAHALALSPFCSSQTINNVDARDVAEADDPLSSVYGYGPLYRQLFYKLTNTTGQRKYAQFTLHNPTGVSYKVAAAVYLESPPTTNLSGSFWLSNGTDVVVLDTTIAAGSDAASKLGILVEVGATVWLEIAGDDTGSHWDGDLLLTWKLLNATFYDALDDGFTDTAAFLGSDFFGNTPITYCKRGDDHFMGVNNAGTIEVWQYTAGVRTIHTIGSNGLSAGDVRASTDYGPNGFLLRTDGTDVWVAIYSIDTVANPYEAGTWTPARLQVMIFDGAGFTTIGHDDAKTSNLSSGGRRGQLTAAASTGEPGVLHVMWSEAGYELNNGTDQKVGQRVAYSKWGPGGVVSLGDVYFNEQTYAVGTFQTGSNPDGAGVFPPASSVVSQWLFITNSSGAPIAFYGRPTHVDQLGAPAGTITYGKIVEMWSMGSFSVGVPTVLQSFDGVTVNGAITSLSSTLSLTFGGTRVPTEVSGVETIYVLAAFNGSHNAFLVVPADGSSSITLHSELGRATIQDAVDDGDNIWIGTGQFQTSGGEVGQFDRKCLHDWNGYDISPLRLSGNGIEMRIEGDTLYTVGSDTGRTRFAPISVAILRDFLICSIGDCAVASSGLHIDDRVHW